MNRRRINVSIRPSVHEKAKKDSKEMYGEVNVSELINELITKNKPKKNEKH